MRVSLRGRPFLVGLQRKPQDIVTGDREAKKTTAELLDAFIATKRLEGRSERNESGSVIIRSDVGDAGKLAAFYKSGEKAAA